MRTETQPLWKKEGERNNLLLLEKLIAKKGLLPRKEDPRRPRKGGPSCAANHLEPNIDTNGKLKRPADGDGEKNSMNEGKKEGLERNTPESK